MSLSTSQVVQKLHDGNLRFAENHPHASYTATEQVAAHAGQKPCSIVVGCSDSRVPVEAVFDADAGELFVVRTAGHILDTTGLISVRFALEKLGARTVIILGHEDCGAVTAALTGTAPEWLSPITTTIQAAFDSPPTDAAPDAATLTAAIEAHVRATVKTLQTWVAELELTGTPPTIIGAVYQLTDGAVRWLK